MVVRSKLKRIAQELDRLPMRSTAVAALQPTDRILTDAGPLRELRLSYTGVESVPPQQCPER
jgi:hypothetical protein